MFTFTSFPSQASQLDYGATRHHPDIADELDMDVDIDDEETGAVGFKSKLTSPGEALTSSQAFMRYDWLARRVVYADHLQVLIHSFQWTWHVCRRRRSDCVRRWDD